MSGGAVRKVQPFTIGTKLSVPTEHRNQDQVADVHLPRPPLNSCEPQGESEDQRGPAAPCCPDGPQVLCDDEADEDGNPTSPTVSSRSIRKIAICRNTEVPTAPSRGLDAGILVKSTPEVNSVHPSSPAQEGGEEKHSSSYSKDGEVVEAEINKEEEEVTVMKTTSEHLLRWLLSNYQQDVKLALDVSSFYQQADSILSSINRKRGESSVSAEQRSREMEEITNQITLLEQCVLRLSDLHPTLAARVTQKQAEVQDCWAALQAQSRAEQTDCSTGCCEEVEAGLGAALQESTTSTDKTLWWLKDSVSSQQEEENQPDSMSKEEVMSKATVYNQDMKTSTLTLRINSLLSRCAELSMDVLDTETDMLVRCDLDRSDLEGLQEQQQKLEMDQQLIRQEVEELEQLTSDLQAVLAEEAEEVQASLQAWEELGWSMNDNRSALQQFQQLQVFLRSYLAMISWAEETRARIFSELSMQKLRQAESAELSELDRRIQQKFEDFDDLVELGRRLVKDRHHLADIIKERTEELQSMLGWILVHWKAQKDQLGQRESDSTQVSLHQHKTVSHQHQPQLQPLSSESAERLESLFPEHKQETAEEPKEGSDVQGENSNKPAFILRQGSCDETAKPAGLVLEEPRAAVTPLGGSISVILTFDQQLEGNHGPAEHHLSPEPIHRVSTYLQVTDGNLESPGCKDSASDPKPATTLLVSPSPPTSSTTATFLPKVSTVILPTLPTATSVSTLSLKPTARRRKRHTVTGLTGVDSLGREAPGLGGAARRANTWPQEGKATGQISSGSPVNTEIQLYIKNSSVVTVAQEGASGSLNVPMMQGDYRKSAEENADQEKTRYSIPLGSILSFQLPTNWDDISNLRSKGLTVERKPPEKTGDCGVGPNAVLSNLYRPPDLSPNATGKVFTVNPERDGSVEDPQEVMSGSLRHPEEGESHHGKTDAIRMRSNREAKDELIVREDVTNTCPSTESKNTCMKQSQKCLSVHTKICDLKGHIYYPPRPPGHTSLITQRAEGLSNSSNPRSSRSGRVVVCSEDGCSVCGDGSTTPRTIPGQGMPHSRVSEKRSDPLRPERWQFEEVEDELEDIWNAVDRERAP